jgi:molybdenum cofactor cytidylyltransferase
MQEHKSVLIAILAAGASRRMGQPKAFLEWRGTTLLDKILAEARALDQYKLVLITGAYHRQMQESYADSNLELVFNPGWEEGMASSVRLAAELARKDSKIEGLMVLLIDQPYVDQDLLRALVGLFKADSSKPAASYYAGVAGVPAIFPRHLFPSLMQLHGDKGAGKLLNSLPEVSLFPFDQGIIDLDSPDDLLRNL